MWKTPQIIGCTSQGSRRNSKGVNVARLKVWIYRNWDHKDPKDLAEHSNNLMSPKWVHETPKTSQHSPYNMKTDKGQIFLFLGLQFTHTTPIPQKNLSMNISFFSCRWHVYIFFSFLFFSAQLSLSFSFHWTLLTPPHLLFNHTFI